MSKENENFYLMLELAPEVSDEEKIKSVIKNKRIEWTKYLIHPEKDLLAKKYLSMVTEIEKVMLNPELRKLESEEARLKILKKRKKELKKVTENIEMICSGGFVNEYQLEKMIKRFPSFKESEIRKLLPKDIEIRSSLTQQKTITISEGEKKEIERRLKIIDKTDLYSFLDIIPSTSLMKIKEKINLKDSDIKRVAKKSADITAMGELIGYCLVHFKSEVNRSKYDNSLKEQVFEEIKQTLGLFNSGDTLSVAQYDTIIKQSQSNGIARKDADAYIKRFAKKKSVYLEVSSEDTNVKSCGYCGSIVRNTSSNCANCGCPTIMKCPKCKEKNASNNKSCTSCGFSMCDMPNALTHLRKANSFLNDKNFTNAKAELDTAENFWPDHPKIKKLKNKINEGSKQIQSLYQKLKSLIDEKHYYQAYNQIIENDHLLYNKRFELLKKDIEEKYKITKECLRKAASYTLLQDKYDAYDSALRISADCEIARKELMKIPPESPQTLNAELKESQVHLSWKGKKQKGEVSFILIRKKHSFPNNRKDGVSIYEGTATNFHDTIDTSGIPFYYSVFACRNGSYSAHGIVNNTPLILLSGVEKLIVKKQHNALLLEWVAPIEVKEVEISYQIKEKNQLFKKIRIRNGKECRIPNLINGQIYILNIRVVYTPFKGKEEYSVMRSIESTPEAPPKGLIDWVVTKKDESLQCRWSPLSKGDIEFFISEDEFNFQLNELISEYEMKGRYGISEMYNGTAKIPLNFQGTRYIIPILKKNEYRIAGAVKKVKHIKEIDKLFLKLKGNDVLVTWLCSKDTKELILRYGYQKDNLIKEERIQSESTTQSVLLSNLHNNEKQLYVELHAKVGKTISKGIESAISLRKTQVKYDVGISSSIGQSKINFSITVEGTLPADLILVQGKNALPLSIGGPNNVPLFNIQASELHRGKLRKSILLTSSHHPSKKLYFRLFTKTNLSSEQIEILDNRKIIDIKTNRS